MKTEDNVFNFKKELSNEAKKHQIELSEQVLQNLEMYKDLMLEWNEKVNLTAITDEKEIILKHFIDCLECTKYINKNESVIDVGTGAGFPGLVIAIYFEGCVKVTLLDSLEKRLKFIQEVINTVDIKNINLIHGRAEDEGMKKENREKYDIATSRAVAGLNVLLEYTTPYIKVGGKCLLMKGDNLDQEIDISKNALKKLNCRINNKYEYTLECKEEAFKRKILEVKKDSSTPIIYPRNPAKIKKDSL
jgi:16S rRNA (guanine527-N7)-methyltransferase